MRTIARRIGKLESVSMAAETPAGRRLMERLEYANKRIAAHRAEHDPGELPPKLFGLGLSRADVLQRARVWFSSNRTKIDTDKSS